MTIEDLPQASAGTTDEVYNQIEQVGDQLARVRTSIGRVIFGQSDVVDETLITLVAGGHQRMGENVTAACSDGTQADMKIVSPVFYDPKGERQRV